MRTAVNTTLDKDLYLQIKMLAMKISNEDIREKTIYANDLIEEGMRLVLDKYNNAKGDNANE